jgi:hypothetical protein
MKKAHAVAVVGYSHGDLLIIDPLIGQVERHSINNSINGLVINLPHPMEIKFAIIE